MSGTLTSNLEWMFYEYCCEEFGNCGTAELCAAGCGLVVLGRWSWLDAGGTVGSEMACGNTSAASRDLCCGAGAAPRRTDRSGLDCGVAGPGWRGARSGGCSVGCDGRPSGAAADCSRD